MSDDTLNIRIKTLPPAAAGEPPRAVTTKVFLVSGSEMAEGARPLEPNEVVSLPREHAVMLLEALPYHLELTADPATRPLYFRNSDEAAMTSQYYNPNTASRVEQARQAMANMLEDAQSETPEHRANLDKMSALEQQNRALQEQIEGLTLAMEALKHGDNPHDVDGYEPTDNVSTMQEIQATARQELAAEAGVAEEEVQVSDLKRAPEQSDETQVAPEVPKPRRRRRRAVA